MIKPVFTFSLLAGLFFLVSCGGGTQESGSGEAGSESAELDTELPAEGTSKLGVELLNPNRATPEELAALPGITDELAQQIFDNRPYLSMATFDSQYGATFEEEKEQVYGSLFIPLNLNTAPESEIKMIPGVGDKMAHEFEEYRPYVKMAQFRKEIGKYVDDNEVERLTQYVFVPVNLNEATEAEILAIPGVGEKMAHEFEEYRPYSSMEQFRKEIGKYVDEAEVSRLERYVTLQ